MTKEKVLQGLKTKYKSFGLNQSTLEAMAETLAAQLTDESDQDDIDAKIESAENLLKSFQSEADKRVTDAVAKAKGTQSDAKQDPPAEKKEGNEQSEVAKMLQEMRAELNSLKGEKVTTNRRQTLEKALENVDPKFKTKALKDFGRMIFEKDEDFDSYLEETVTDLGNIASTEIKSGGVNRPPMGGGKSDKATDAELDDIVAAL